MQVMSCSGYDYLFEPRAEKNKCCLYTKKKSVVSAVALQDSGDFDDSRVQSMHVHSIRDLLKCEKHVSKLRQPKVQTTGTQVKLCLRLRT